MNPHITNEMRALVWHQMAVALVASPERAVTNLPAPDAPAGEWADLRSAVRKRWRRAPNYVRPCAGGRQRSDGRPMPPLNIDEQVERTAAFTDYNLVIYEESSVWPRLPVDDEMDNRLVSP